MDLQLVLLLLTAVNTILLIIVLTILKSVKKHAGALSEDDPTQDPPLPPEP